MGLKELEAFLEKANALIAKQKQDGIEPSPELARKALDALAAYSGEPPEIALSLDRVINADGRNIPVRIYHPSPAIKLPTMLFIHGGGHMCGGVNSYDVLCRKLSIVSDCVVVSVDYRLAPEFPYPSGLDDCREVLARMDEVLCDVLSDKENVIICGDSGGGTFAATLASEDRHGASPSISGQILIYPSLDYTQSSGTYEKYARGYFLETERVSWYFDNYFRNGDDRVKASPLFNMGENIPPTLIISAQCDPIAGDSIKYGVHLAERGVYTEFVEYPSIIHAFMFLESILPDEVTDAYSRIGTFVKKIVAVSES